MVDEDTTMGDVEGVSATEEGGGTGDGAAGGKEGRMASELVRRGRFFFFFPCGGLVFTRH